MCINEIFLNHTIGLIIMNVPEQKGTVSVFRIPLYL